MKFKNLVSLCSSRGPALAGALAVVLAGAVVVPAHAADDDFPPVVTLTPTPSLPASGWYSDSVTVEVKATESQPGDQGVKSLSYLLTGATTGGEAVAGTLGAKSLARSVVVTNEGVTTVHATATDWVENPSLEQTTEIRIDRTQPQTDWVAPVNGDVYSLGQQVTADYGCSDALSDIASCSGTYARGARIYTGAAGDYTIWATATDKAGNRRDVPVSYTVVDKLTVKTPASRVGSGEPRVGTVLTGGGADFSPTPDSLSCSWLRDDVVLAEPSKHTVTVEDLDHLLYYQCTARRAGLPEATSTSDPIVPIVGKFPDESPHAIEGEGRVGTQLAFDYSVPFAPGDTRTPQWTRDGVAIAGANQFTYTLTPADFGHTVSAYLRKEAPGYEPRDYPSSTRLLVDKGRRFSSAGQAVVAGTAQVGQQLTATVPTFTPAGAAPATPFEVAVEWLRDGTPVGSGAAYRLTAADAGHRMTARVTAAGAGYETMRVISAATEPVQALPGEGPGEQPGAVASTTRLKLKALGKGRVRATITVVAGSTKPSGKVTIRRGGGKARTVTLKNGRAVVVLKKQRKGRAVYTVSYAGTDALSASKAKAKTRVR